MFHEKKNTRTKICLFRLKLSRMKSVLFMHYLYLNNDRFIFSPNPPFPFNLLMHVKCCVLFDFSKIENQYGIFRLNKNSVLSFKV